MVVATDAEGTVCNLWEAPLDSLGKFTVPRCVSCWLEESSYPFSLEEDAEGRTGRVEAYGEPDVVAVSDDESTVHPRKAKKVMGHCQHGCTTGK